MPELIILAIMFSSLSLYAVLGGADFGAGIWEFTTVLQADKRERKLIHDAIGPVWEANHVWLIFVLIIMFSAFPLAFAAVSRALWLPLLFALLGIVCRGAGYIFRAYAIGAVSLQNFWGAVFALASTATPFFMGASIGAISCGTLAIDSEGRFSGNHLQDWLTPLSLFAGIMAVGMCAYLASVYLTHEASKTKGADLLRTWRGRATSTGIWIGILAWIGLVMCALEAPDLWNGLIARGWPLIAVSVTTGIGSLWALVRNRFQFANLMAASSVASVVVGWGLGQYPILVPPAITIESSKAPPVVLWAMVICILSGSLFLFPALFWLFRLFKGETAK